MFILVRITDTIKLCTHRLVRPFLAFRNPYSRTLEVAVAGMRVLTRTNTTRRSDSETIHSDTTWDTGTDFTYRDREAKKREIRRTSYRMFGAGTEKEVKHGDKTEGG